MSFKASVNIHGKYLQLRYVHTRLFLRYTGIKFRTVPIPTVRIQVKLPLTFHICVWMIPRI